MNKNENKFVVVSSLLIFVLGMCTSALAEQTLSEREEMLRRAAETEVWQPVPERVLTYSLGAPPSDAIVLFDGSDLSQWKSVTGGDVEWTVSNGEMTVKPGAGPIHTKKSFGDVQLHIEWRIPIEKEGEGQDRGNSGVFLMDRYEIQILESSDNPTYANGQAGSIYKQHSPLVNASKAPGEWQSYDIIFLAPEFGVDGKVLRPATMTILHNGVLVQNNAILAGPTTFIGAPSYETHGRAPIRLQDHMSLVGFRNIWLREI